MPEFKKGQLVAVSDTGAEGSWHLRVYSHTSQSGQHYCRNIELPNGPAGWWNHVVPAEEVLPGLCLGVERCIADALREQRDQHYRQIRWLCARLQAIGDRNGSQECPPVPHGDCRIGNCAECWEQASLEAVKEGADDTSEESPALGR